MLRTTLRTLWSHKRRLFGTTTAVVLGVAFVVATLVLGDTLRAGFGDLFGEANAGIDAVVRAESATTRGESVETRPPLDAALVDEVGAFPGAAKVAPRIEAAAQILDADGEPLGGQGPPTLGGNWITAEALNPYQLTVGRAPQAAGEVVIDEGAAERGDLAVGDRTRVLTPAPVEVTVVGIASYPDAESPVTFAAFTTEAAQRYLLGGTDRVGSVAVAAAEGVSEDELVAGIEEDLPSGVEALTGTELTAEQRSEIEADFLGFLETMLLAFAGVALVVATFSINNTFSILVAQRTRESALLRAIGASRRQVLASVTVEALVVGLLAAAVGTGVGLVLAQGLEALLGAFGPGLPEAAMVVEASTLVAALAIGVVVTLLASLFPAVRASRVAPLDALRETTVGQRRVSRLRAGVGAGLVGSGTSAVIMAGAADDRALYIAGLGAVTCLVGLVAFGPVAARGATAVLGWPIGVTRGLVGSLARRNTGRNPVRTASTASALMVGVAVVALFTVLAASLESSIDEQVSETFGGDLVVASEGFSGVGIDPRLAPTTAELPEVQAAAGLGNGPVTMAGDTSFAAVAEPDAIAAVLDLDIASGSISSLDRDQVAIADDVAETGPGLGVGDSLRVGFPDGERARLEVGAVYQDSPILGDLLLTSDLWVAHTPRPSDRSVLIDLAGDVSLDEGRAAVAPVTERFAAPEVMDRDQFIDQQVSGINTALTLVYGLLLLAILIALLGIANTLSLSVHERTRELGLLRAVGLTRGQLRATVRWESVLISVFGTVGGLALGTFLGWGVVRAVAAAEGLGTFAAPLGQLAVVLVLGAAAGVMAALRPSRRAARLDVLNAINAE